MPSAGFARVRLRAPYQCLQSPLCRVQPSLVRATATMSKYSRSVGSAVDTNVTSHRNRPPALSWHLVMQDLESLVVQAAVGGRFAFIGRLHDRYVGNRITQQSDHRADPQCRAGQSHVPIRSRAAPRVKTNSTDDKNALQPKIVMFITNDSLAR